MAVLKARDPITGAWQDVAGVGTPGVDGPTGPEGPTGPTGPIANEVVVGPDDPLVADPTAAVDVWYDTDEPDPPPVGADQFVLKAQVHAHHIYGNVGTSPWVWTLAAGTYLCMFQCSGVASANGIRYVNLNMNGASVGQSKHYFNQINLHLVMNCGVTLLTIPTDGDYSFDITQSASLTMDANDFGHCTLIPSGPNVLVD